VITPRFVFVGAAGLRFQGGDIEISYEFEGELSVQEAYATRPTKTRIILCDHSKLGERAAYKANVDAEKMMAEADECLVISTFPTSDDPDGEKILPVIESQIAGFKKMVQTLKSRSENKTKRFTLLFVDEAGEPEANRKYST
jgi:hypothetical protein